MKVTQFKRFFKALFAPTAYRFKLSDTNNGNPINYSGAWRNNGKYEPKPFKKKHL